jgi:hypothetical protein
LICRFGTLDPTDGGETARYSLSFNSTRQLAGGVLAASAYAVQSSLTLFSNFTFFLEDPINGDQFERTEHRKMYGFDVHEIWRGAELGFRTEAIEGLQMSAALWRLDIDSELVFSGDAGDTEPSRPSYRYGVELNNHYIASNWLLFDLDLAFSRARYTDEDPAGNAIPASIEQVASFRVTVTNIGPWFGQFQLRYFGPRPLIEDNSVRSKSTTLAYSDIGYAVAPQLKLQLDVFNLFNRAASDIDYFYTSRLQGEPLSGVHDIHFHPVEPRTFRLRATYNF